MLNVNQSPKCNKWSAFPLPRFLLSAWIFLLEWGEVPYICPSGRPSVCGWPSSLDQSQAWFALRPGLLDLRPGSKALIPDWLALVMAGPVWLKSTRTPIIVYLYLNHPNHSS